MYETIYLLHSWWAYLVVLVLLITVVNSIIGFASKKEYGAMDLRLGLFTLIVSHIQLLIGIVLYLVGVVQSYKYFNAFSTGGMGEIMKDSTLRLYLVEHPLMMLISVILITVGYSKHKNKRLSNQKFKTLSIFYTLALIFMLSRIPYGEWF